MADIVYGKDGVYVSTPGEFKRGEGGRGTGPVVVLRNIEVILDKCDCEDHKDQPGGPSPIIPNFQGLCELVNFGVYDLTWNDKSRQWMMTEARNGQ